MKRLVRPNEGHLLPDFYFNGISRLYIDKGNIVCILQSRCGIETESEEYANEIARLICPLQDFEYVKDSLDNAAKYIRENVGHDEGSEAGQAANNIDDPPRDPHVSEEILGGILAIFDE